MGSLEPLSGDGPVLVAGAGVTGRAVLAALAPLPVRPTICDGDPATVRSFAEAGVTAISTAEATRAIGDYRLVITSPGFAPGAPVLAAADAAGVPIWGDVELAWRLDRAAVYRPPRRWLVVTGTNGKTTTTAMLAAMLTAAGLPAVACGNIGDPVLTVLDGPAEVLAVEASSFQLHWAPSLRPDAGVVLNIAEDHLDWHGSMAAYAAAKARALTGRVGVAGLDDPVAAALLAAAPAATRVGFRLGAPEAGQLGVRDGWLVDRAFAENVPLAPTDAIGVPGPVGVLDALAAAALARAVAVPAEAVERALRGFSGAPHRGAVLTVADGIRYVDDSKATNPHAAEAAITAYPRVVWVAGGLLKGASVDDTVARVASRLVGAVVIGRDRAEIAKALSRHAPDVPVIEVVTGEDAGVRETGEPSVTIETRWVGSGGGSLGTRVMTTAVAAARELARPGDTVLLAPAGASFDQFAGYTDRGEAFGAAVQAATR
ncbi:UDP-N-acetylmuramoyl-L-alanine--D-glutamate ligase [Mycobacterium koreense]|uniref:UDP-N-acetylmuramoylalanine--D-glutamate ligase n=1 Tax=Mycolicibacillus koreensis TaxID=1069220 RepID=A0A7I7S9F1_9MYCO|nr:UDP-N-acetylmuramoyl-L-alanine--D-glutamate ligase [Mycolicibacillus koreensis]MCV7249399.1 UDP-N-acetylmuramoyl-L-alanine--D-glutamate ligase [Mycolicibacillus koreensis]OSC35236.1 UDP-N-acetylmuramoyl-L-alanine--D-glutamate ligase [Mycolicibacillus koreensis]BBY53313.1 UDP-N-acetylmuramoylalanine--D-glutamate ligase [Mycolicibacillus koreensis]